jgi:beta-glucosidase
MNTLARILLLFVLVVVAACAPVTEAGSVPAPTPTAAVPIYTDPARPVGARVADLLARMSLEEKIGQMAQIDSNALQPGDVTRYGLGSVLSSGFGIPPENTLEGWTGMVDGFQKEALATRLGIPMIYGIDAIHGLGHMQGATLFPHNIGLGATRDPDLVRRIGRATAEEMLAAGPRWNFSPVVAVPQDIRWGRTYEGFGEETGLVSRLSTAYIEGMQTIEADDPASDGQTILVLATPKHYIGDGGVIWNSSVRDGFIMDQGNAQMPEDELRALFLPPYQAAVDAGAMSVMVSFSSWNGTRLHGHRYLVTSVLKDEMQFPGFVISDYRGMDQIYPDDYYASIVQSVNAGVDMNMVPLDAASFIGVVRKAVEDGDISMARIDDAVTRILRVKFMMGLFEHPYSDQVYWRTVRSSEHIALARQAVQESLVLLKNENGALPLSRDVPLLLVAGRGADSTGLQTGGWTLSWQGVTGQEVVGTTILDGIERLAGDGCEVRYRSAGVWDDVEGIAPAGIVVVAEDPYAEGVGDKGDLALAPADVALIEQMRPKVEKLAVVILSGRPMVITEQYQMVDAWVAAWLPGSEGDAIADVLFGDVPFTGRTPYTWPRSNRQLPINVNNSAGKTGCDAPLFPYGYGLGDAGSQPIEWIDCPAK